MEEIWKPVPTKWGLLASSWGRIKLPMKFVKMPNGGSRTYKPKPTFGVIRRARKGAAHSYRAINSKAWGNIKIHQAVCEAFNGPKPFRTAVVIHIDENGHNNRPENLRWGTQKENLNSQRFLEYCRSRTGDNHPRAKSLKARAAA